jgi:hypothetical protein
MNDPHEALKPYVWGERSDSPQAEIARELGLNEGGHGPGIVCPQPVKGLTRHRGCPALVSIGVWTRGWCRSANGHKLPRIS